MLRETKRWTYRLFVERPDLFLPWMEKGKAVVRAQVDGLRKFSRSMGSVKDLESWTLPVESEEYLSAWPRKGTM